MKFNAIKILEQEKQETNLFNKNVSKEYYMNNVYKFVDDYIKPILDKLSYERKITNKLSSQLAILTTQITNDLGLVDTNNNDIEGLILSDDEMGFLSKDKKIKKQVAQKICDYVMWLYDKVKNNDIED